MSALSAAFWAIVAGLRLGMALRGHPLSLPLAALSFLAAVRLVRRRPPVREASLPRRLAAWGAALLPWGAGLFPGAPAPLPLRAAGEALQLLGVLLALWALLALGEAFGIAPADRGLAERGPYRRIRHPMYLGEAMAFAGWLLERPSLEGAGLLLAAVALAALRIRWEEEVLGEAYRAYAARVRWRMIPLVW
ncbi:methyltransferase family protein [Thermoflexus sp.]|uniref:methyltransferase family protein n=1 Tax=Thermoflexus sp. TaxID=1969742 RepID=UPI002ADDDDAF|nr:methyltransferase [Thermoflexus sp.]